MTQNPEALLSVLQSLGVLFQAPGAENVEPVPAGGAAPVDHVFHNHTPLWDFEVSHIAKECREFLGHTLYESLPPDMPLDEVLQRTKLIVFLGAENTDTFRRCLATPGTLALILEPDRDRLRRFAQAVPPRALANRAIILHGLPRHFTPPLSLLIPPHLFHLGYPVFYGLEQLLAQAPGYVEEMVELVELLFFRFRIYPISGQANSRGLPLRPMLKGLFYDQQLHAYRNTVALATQPDISHLRKAFLGETAILVAAGPDLAERLDFVRRNKSACVVIAVNNALKPLLAAGIRPHFVISNDTSVLTARSWEGLPRLNDVSLVAHCLTDLGDGIFGKTYLFGNYLPEVFGTRPNLRLHGSVITTAFSLARHMGCARCIFVGAQLCSRDPWSLTYAKGSIHSAEPSQDKPLTNAYPQLYPVRGEGHGLYTSLNFLDAARWLLDEIRVSGITCVNTTDQSLLSGPGIVHDPDPAIAATGRLAARLGRVAALRPRCRDQARAAQIITREWHNWRSVAMGCAKLLEHPEGKAFVTSAMAALRQFDASGVSYLVQRFEDFENAYLHLAVFQEPDPEFYLRLGMPHEVYKTRHLQFYLECVQRMAATFASILEEQKTLLEALRIRQATSKVA